MLFSGFVTPRCIRLYHCVSVGTVYRDDPRHHEAYMGPLSRSLGVCKVRVSAWLRRGVGYEVKPTGLDRSLWRHTLNSCSTPRAQNTTWMQAGIYVWCKSRGSIKLGPLKISSHKKEPPDSTPHFLGDRSLCRWRFCVVTSSHPTP